MSGPAFSLTPAQASAVTTRGSALLVSAAAGSGKTKVLVERLLSYITDAHNPCDITEFLVITYTRAAAAELKSRIADEIAARIADDPENRHLRRQAALTAVANIDTIHGFCNSLLRENAHLVQLQPDFRVADDSETGLLKADVLEELLDRRYDDIGSAEGFRLLVDTLSAGRDDKRLTEVVLDAHAALLSHADPEGWVRAQCRAMELTSLCDAGETMWGRYLMEDARRKAVYWRGALSRLLDEAVSCPEFMKAYGDSLNETLCGLDGLIAALAGSWDAARALAAVPFPKAKSVKGYEDLKETRNKCKDALKKLSAVFESASKDLLEDMSAVGPAVTALLELVLEFDGAYAAAKRRRGIVDFSDQEHLAVRLLTVNSGITDIARTVSGRFREILIDEYQDCSAVQELIFRAVSHKGRNIFMVGDVKQSIYRFRLADPTIFISKYKRYKDVTEEPAAEASEDTAVAEVTAFKEVTAFNEGRRILLSTNFRSSAAILDAVNFIFQNIMSEELGDLDYTALEFLYPGRRDSDARRDPVEIDILELKVEDDDEEEDAPDKTTQETEFVAGRIAALLDGGMTVPDGRGGVRPVVPGDIAILLRSVKEKAAVYAQALSSRQIPVSLPGSEGFFETPEISLALSFLDIIDNPMQDVPLIAVLRSPVYGFTPDELAAIRLADKSADLYTALLKAAENDTKCQAFVDALNAYRNKAPDMPADRLLWHLYNTTGLPGIMGSLRGGQTRRDNLMRLAELAGRYEQSGYKGVFGFMRFVRRLLELGGGATDAGETLSAGAVNIMSIHKSKGLEFPVVILADTAKRFNLKDAAKPLLIHAGLGVGMKRAELTRRIEYPTLPRLAVAKALTRETLSEELRVLYVALTRAREKLIIVATLPDAGRELGKLSKLASQPVPPQLLEGMNSMAQLILTPVLTRPEAVSLFGGPEVPSATVPSAPCGGALPENAAQPLFDIHIITRGETQGTYGQAVSDADILAPWEEAELREKAMRLQTDGGVNNDGTGDDQKLLHTTESMGRAEVCCNNTAAEIAGTAASRADSVINTDEATTEGAEAAIQPADSDAAQALRRSMAFRYPYQKAETMPSKLTATELKGRFVDLEASEEAEARVYAKKPGYVSARPVFAAERTALTAAERGTALHLAMQYIDYTRCGNIVSIKEELRRLKDECFLSAKQYEAVDTGKIAAFFESPLGQRVLKADKLYREFKFSLLVQAGEYDENGESAAGGVAEGDTILFQGVVDCCFEENGVLHIIDFKSDAVTKETLGEKTALYAEQIKAYGLAMNTITGLPVGSLTLYFFSLDREIPVS
jgi:ATP-dependent helicase/nuclease subunit A